MTKKEIYQVALRATQEALRAYFRDEIGFKDSYLQKTINGKFIVKKVYDTLEPKLLSNG